EEVAQLAIKVSESVPAAGRVRPHGMKRTQFELAGARAGVAELFRRDDLFSQYGAEQLIEQLRNDVALESADTVLITSPSQLGVN
ncbi:MAG: hypothetical protein M3N46_06820, partial [Actinomycetota bacterium]|nr:hypothetical protein [Actinomycetota bacterium]